MGWFDEQVRQRIENDQAAFQDAFTQMAGAVIGGRASAALGAGGKRAENAIQEILNYYHIKPQKLPDNLKDLNEQLEYLMRPSGVMRRQVTLEKGWYKDAIGPMLGTRTDDGSVVALIPSGFSGYRFFDETLGKYRKLSRRTEGLIAKDAICFYKPFPLKKLTLADLSRYLVESLSLSDFVLVGLSTLAVTLVGMLTPRLNSILFSTVIQSGNLQLLWAITVFFLCVSAASLFLSAVRTLLMARINTKLDLSVQAATMMRILSLPADFFKQFSSGELSSRTHQITALTSTLANTLLSTGLTSLFSLSYLGQIFVYAPGLVVPALTVTVATAVLTATSTLAQMKISQRQMELSAQESGLSYALITGVQKLKLAGAERRSFARWAEQYSKGAALLYNPPLFLKLNGVISTGISLIGSIVMYYFAVVSGVSVADYYAFNTAYGMVSGAFLSLSGMALTAAQIKPVYEMVKPILQAVPEVSEGKRVVTRLSGGIELNNISFRYGENTPLVIDDLSLKIRPGQYVAIVGATGCGKSTLMRLMLGFETPQKGAVYYDGRDLAQMDLRSLRRNIGVVMQNGKLFQGDIYSNIIIAAPWLTLEQAWEAAELAGIADDIRDMPMGMHTLISEGSGGVSGGQRQRLMIARAVAPKPKILMFDEATSALDNLTQKIVSQSLDGLKCTRIVIAHRLSTIRQCDRIVVLDQGRIIEDGTYEQLMSRNGYFAELVARQRPEEES